MHDRNVTTIKPHPGATHSKATAQYRVIADQCILGACQHVDMSTSRLFNLPDRPVILIARPITFAQFLIKQTQICCCRSSLSIINS